MSDCCLPNLGCLSIPILSTNVAGNTGAPGAAATIAVGTVTTVNPGDPATVTNVGTSGAAIFDFEIPEGAAGTPGGAGVNGVSRLYSMPIDFFSATLVNQWVQQHDYTVAANTLINDGDALVINLVSAKFYNLNNVVTISGQRRIRWGLGTSAGISVTYIPSFSNEPFYISNDYTFQYNTRVEIIKSSATTAICRVTVDLDLNPNIIGAQTFTYQNDLIGLDFTVLNTIYTDLYQAVVNQVYFKSITIDKISAV
jgi:hypothetical protein